MKHWWCINFVDLFIFVLRFYSPVNPMGSCRAWSVYLTTHLLGRLSRLTSIVQIISPETENCPSCISGRVTMTVENISRSISTKECCWPRRGLNPRPPGLQSDGTSNWATEAGVDLFKVGKLSKQNRYKYHFYRIAVETDFYGDTGRVIAFFRS